MEKIVTNVRAETQLAYAQNTRDYNARAVAQVMRAIPTFDAGAEAVKNASATMHGPSHRPPCQHAIRTAFTVEPADVVIHEARVDAELAAILPALEHELDDADSLEARRERIVTRADEIIAEAAAPFRERLRVRLPAGSYVESQRTLLVSPTRIEDTPYALFGWRDGAINAYGCGIDWETALNRAIEDHRLKVELAKRIAQDAEGAAMADSDHDGLS